MHELDTIGDYEVRVIEHVGSVVRFAATHVVLPRRAIIELLAADAPRTAALELMRRACILEALQHPAVPRVFECGRVDSRPWIAIAHEQGATLHDELKHRGLEVREALTLLEEVAAFLSHAHSRGVLHGNITAIAIVRAPTLLIQRWENARAHNSVGVIDGREDVLALGNTMWAALARPSAVPEGLARLLERMRADDPAARPTAPEVVASVCALRDAIGTIDDNELDHVIEGLAIDADDEGPDIVIEYPANDDDDEYILLERRAATFETVIVDLDACG